MIKKAFIFSLIAQGIFIALGILFTSPLPGFSLVLLFIPFLVLDYLFYKSHIKGKKTLIGAIAVTEILFFVLLYYLVVLGVWLGMLIYQSSSNDLSSQKISGFINNSIVLLLNLVTRAFLYWGTVKVVSNKQSKRIT